MREKYKDLFNGKLEIERQGKDVVAIGDKDYLFCEIDDGLTHEDGKEMQRAVYIANAANNFADMYDTLETIKRHILNMPICDPHLYGWVEENIDPLLKRARGE